MLITLLHLECPGFATSGRDTKEQRRSQYKNSIALLSGLLEREFAVLLVQRLCIVIFNNLELTPSF